MNAPRSSTLLLCSIVTLLAWPALARAQAPDPERPAIRLGPFELRPRLALTNMGVDNNVFNDSTDPKRDFTFTAIPDLEVSVHPGRLRLAYNTGTEFVYFHEYTSERSLNRNFGARADLDLTILKPFAAFTYARTSARPNSEIDARAEHRPQTYSAGTHLKLASRTEMVFTARELRDAYADGEEFRGVELAETLNEKTRAYRYGLQRRAHTLYHRRRRSLERGDAVRLVTAAELRHAPGRPDADVQPSWPDHRHRVHRLPALQRSRSFAAGLQRPRLGRLHRHPVREPLQARHHLYPRRALLIRGRPAVLPGNRRPRDAGGAGIRGIRIARARWA